ncbi:Hypothetical protein CINCED_3A002487 [Cinara cedri]|uniref:Uncharacterized protein n=1 Tax=Cinara cedri TaxID=506608 RepID=A0A5E4NDL6_9HEMI|nr:Hypothetical protein CINCED_3A002487 [Cinara cedri]
MECDQGVRDKEFYETKGKLLTDQAIITHNYVRTRLVNTNPDEEEIKKLRPKLEEMKAHRECVTKENMLLKEKFKINNYPLPGDIIV